MRTGDIVGVAVCSVSRTVRFLDGGVNPMGEALPLPDGPIAPFVYMGGVQGDAISLHHVEPIPRVLASISRFQRTPPPSRIVISTWEEDVYYEIEVDPRTTVQDVYEEAATRQHPPVMQIQLIYRGRTLSPSSERLADVDIVPDKWTGIPTHDIHLSVPHLVS